MRFKPGKEQNHLRGKGGPRPGAGRPSAKQKRVRKEATQIAREYIKKHIKPVLQAYVRLAIGGKARRLNEKTGKVVSVDVEADGATLRHYLDKILPSKQDTDVNLSGSVEIFTNVDVDLGPPKRGSE